MTTGFQQQQHNYGPILKAVARPQHVGAKLIPARDAVKQTSQERTSFKPSPIEV